MPLHAQVEKLRFSTGGVTLLVGLLVGCGPHEPVRHYTIPKPELIHAGPRYEVPEGWSMLPPAPFSLVTLGMRQGDRAVQITVSQLMGDAGGLLANLNRWYQQTGLPEIAEGELDARTQAWEVDGITGTYAEALSEEGQGGELGLVGWIGIGADRSWFVKMAGDPQLVRQQRDRFRGFLKSLHFNSP